MMILTSLNRYNTTNHTYYIQSKKSATQTHYNQSWILHICSDDDCVQCENIITPQVSHIITTWGGYTQSSHIKRDSTEHLVPPVTLLQSLFFSSAGLSLATSSARKVMYLKEKTLSYILAGVNKSSPNGQPECVHLAQPILIRQGGDVLPQALKCIIDALHAPPFSQVGCVSDLHLNISTLVMIGWWW